MTKDEEARARPETVVQGSPVAYRCWDNPKNAYGTFDSLRIWLAIKPEGAWNEPLYTTPTSKPWVGLTDEEVMVAAYQAGFEIHEDYENEDDPEAMHWWTPDGEACDDSLLKLRDLIEAKLKEKNT